MVLSFVTKRLSQTVSQIFNGECDAMVDMILNDLYTKSRSFTLVTNDFSHTTSYRLIIFFLHTRTHCLATIGLQIVLHNDVTDDNRRRRRTYATL